MPKLLVLCLLVLLSCTCAHSEEIWVPATTSSGAWTSTLIAGQLYLFEVSGVYEYAPGMQADAEWLYVDGEWLEFMPEWGSQSWDVLDLVTGTTCIDWLGGPDWQPHTLSPDHVYRCYYTGQGASVKVWIPEAFPQFYSNNSGGLTLKIAMIPELPSLITLGCGVIGLVGLARRRR